MAAGSNSLNLIVNANSPIFQYGPLPWTSSEFVQYYGSAIMTPDFSVGINDLNDSTLHAPYATFSLSFEGSAIAFIGNTPMPTSTQTFVVTIDGGIPYETSYDDRTPQSYTQWYQSPTLEEGTHTVTVDGLAGTSLDYAVITVGPSTPLAGTQVIVDNEDPAIQWSSGWKFDAAQFDSGFLPDGFTYQNSTRHSSAAGDLMTFRFQGTSVSIYGILSYFEVGMVSATFTLDGESTPQTYIVTEDDLVSNQGDLPNFLFITYSNLLPQDHTLTINITRCINQAFMLDYITYTPSFYNLALMDNLSLPLDSPASSLSELELTNPRYALHQFTRVVTA
ncbi:hypothetical protein BDN70DRAFT_861062 [Pholiota conissans]|uniref:Uncharacterized protein n=1 Tax=Pholiota conissans TaxID=109636 RepID=A0A9P5Z094_9AGAR|nr:hypothetical protein BDN70DRAFT_861062 [Pholiota conissans]